MEQVKQTAKRLVLNSPVDSMIPKETIEEIFSNIVIFETKEELMAEYAKYDSSMEHISAFTHEDKIYIGPESNPDKLIHNIVHEVLHIMSKKWDKNGKIIQNGMQCTKGQRFSNFLNEGVTDYLTKKIVGGNYCQYPNEAKLFEGIDLELVRYFEDEDILFRMYLQDDNTGLQNKRFKEFLDNTRGEGAYDELYENISFMNKEKIKEYVAKVHKGVNKYVRKRNLKRTIDKIRGIFTKKNDVKQLNEQFDQMKTRAQQTISEQDITLELQVKINETYEEFSPREIKEKDNLQL